MPRWTEDQNEAIIARGSNLLVSAAAGSGKTAVLVERIIRLLIEDHVPIDSMLIVTFTNAAASEMRERIVEALYAKLDEQDDAFLRDQIGRVQNAYIMTLHAFCIGVIRSNAHFIDLDPGFKVGDTVDLNILMNDALEMTLESFYEEGSPAYHQFVESYSENRTDNKLSQLVMNTFKFIQSQPEPLKWLRNAVVAMDDMTFYETLLKEYLAFHLNGLSELLDECLVMAESDMGPQEYVETLLQDRANFDHVSEALKNGIDDFVETVRTIGHPRLKSIKKDRKEEVDPVLMDEVKALRAQYKDVLNDLQAFFMYKSFGDYLEDLKTSQKMMQVLFDLVERFSSNYQDLKEDQNLVDFNDLEHLALKALKQEDVQTYYQKKFEYIFLDEYQDSNLVQESLVNAIKRSNNVFLVGDVKQSIYRFRLADPSLFMEKYESYEKLATAVNRRIDLKKNFRSRREILEGINFIFENLMSKTFGEMVYDEDAMLYPGIEFGQVANPAIEVKIIETTIEDDVVSDMNAAELEAVAIAKSIKAYKGQMSYDRKRDTYFDLEYRHMVILMRAVSQWTPIFADIFLKEGIPLYADNQSGYFDTVEIKMFVDLLRLIDNPLQDIPLLTVLRSPIFDFSMDDIMAIRLANQKGSFHEALTTYEGDETLVAKIEKMKDRLDTWRQRILFESLDEVLWSIMIDTGYFQYVGAMPGGKMRQGNLRLLIDRAEQYGQTRSLFGFLQLIDKMKVSSTELGTAKVIGESENVVRIMSIHKSKGLEFPLVYVAAMGKRFNLRDAYQDVLMHKHIGLGPKWVDPVERVYCDTLPKKLIKHAIKFESLAEEMRILYVALTRAVDKLILVGNVKLVDKAAAKWTRGSGLFNLMNGQSYLDWSMMILCKHPAFKEIWSMAEKPYLGLKTHETKWHLEIIKHGSLVVDHNRQHQPLSKIFNRIQDYRSEAMAAYLDQRFDYKYPYAIAALMPSKFSVSELKRLRQEGIKDINMKVDALNRVPAFMKAAVKKTRAEIGTLMHFVMQQLDRKEGNYREQVKKFIENGLIMAEEADYIDMDKIETFFSQDIGQRYVASASVHIEKPFVLKKSIQEVLGESSEDDILIQGIIDCYFEEADGIVLIDYKTDYIYGDGELLKDRYEEQLRLYKEAIEAITDHRVKEVYIYSFFKNKSILVELD